MIVPERESVMRTIPLGTRAYSSAPWADATDEAVLGGVARRDEGALAALYDRYAGVAYGLAYRILGERGAAEDVVQEAFLSIWRRAGSFEPQRGSARRWLLAIVHHRAIDRVRGAAGRVWLEASLDERDHDADRVLTVDDPWHDVDLRLRGALLKRGLAGLSETQRRTLELAFFDGYTQCEIATLLGVPVGTIKSRIRTGLQRLRATLEDREGEQRR